MFPPSQGTSKKPKKKKKLLRQKVPSLFLLLSITLDFNCKYVSVIKIYCAKPSDKT